MEGLVALPRDAQHHVSLAGTSDLALLVEGELDEKRAIAHVADDGAGATVLFSGTTRNSFQGEWP